MFALFLILCYFILIFNILIPTIGEKLRIEHDAFVLFKQLYGNKFICIDKSILATYTYTPVGVQAIIPIHSDGSFFKCGDEIIDSTNTINCNNQTDPRFINTCDRAYAELFFRI